MQGGSGGAVLVDSLSALHLARLPEGPRNAKADGVLPFFERAGQRHAQLKRVAQTLECRLLFTAGVQHIFNP